MGIEMRLELRMGHGTQHSAIDNPEITADAYSLIRNLGNRETLCGKVFSRDPKSCINLSRILKKGGIPHRDKMIQMEAFLLSQWGYDWEKMEWEYDWQRYLDAPLISHADAILSLKSIGYDSVVGIKEAGVPYAKIFEIFGIPSFEIDFSHHKRKMEQPEIDTEHLERLKHCKKTLITDIDFVTGKTLRDVVSFLREKEGVNVNAAYIGLSQWPGIETNYVSISKDTVNFDTFWRRGEGLCELRNRLPYRAKILPDLGKVHVTPTEYGYLRVFSANPNIDKNVRLGSKVARRAASYFK